MYIVLKKTLYVVLKDMFSSHTSTIFVGNETVYISHSLATLFIKYIYIDKLLVLKVLLFKNFKEQYFMGQIQLF